MIVCELTPLQEAYWVGEQGVTHLFGRALGYHEIKFNLKWSKIRFDRALAFCLRKYPILMATITASGQLKIDPKNALFKYDVYDSTQQLSAQIANIRFHMHKYFPSLNKQLFQMVIIHNESSFTIHYMASLILLDGIAGHTFISTLINCFQDYKAFAIANPMNPQFVAYIEQINRYKMSEKYTEDKLFWEERVRHFPENIQLPINQKMQSLEWKGTERRSFKISTYDWHLIQQQCRHFRVTPSMAILTAFLKVLAVYSNSEHLLLSMMIVDREYNADNNQNLMGNLSDIMLCDFNIAGQHTMAELVVAQQRKVFQYYAHHRFSGVEVARMHNREKAYQNFSPIPIVFSSTLGLVNANQTDLFVGEYVSGSIQSPGIWIDHQVVETQDGLNLYWDYVVDFFPEGFIETLLSTYEHYLSSLAMKDQWISTTHLRIPAYQIKERAIVNLSYQHFNLSFLDDGLRKHAHLTPNKNFLVSEGRQFTFRQTSNYVNNLTYQLLNLNVKSADIVAILLPKSWRQVVAAYGILRCGGTYLPLDCDLSADQISSILKQVNCKLLISQVDLLDKLEIQMNYLLFDAVSEMDHHPEYVSTERKLTDIAYIIFTSGSTGTPKGVMIDHQGAVNTILDINERMTICAKDTVLMCSGFHFDLSVYDIFGLAFAGGSVVIPEHEKQKDVTHWLELINTYDVSIWNTVPALFALLVESAEINRKFINKLNKVLLSGDWIPLYLPTQAKQLNPDLQIICLGGATEASIWSNYYVINDKLSAAWTSIPYGFPLSNQELHILDAHLNPVPDWVSGDLYIGGQGVAVGYINNKILTDAAFIRAPFSDLRLYRTGDKARYRPGGMIEFLGREDGQIKINGYRIELGEIESYINKILGENGALVRYFKDKVSVNKIKTLVAFMLDPQQMLDPMVIKAQLRQYLPEYKIPTLFIQLKHFPLNQNGKIDNKKLLEQFSAHMKSKKNVSQSERVHLSDTENKLNTLWCELLTISEINIHDSFMECGGTSLTFIKMVMQVRELFKLDIEFSQAINYQTIQSLATYIDKQGIQSEQPIYITCQSKGDKIPFICVHPIGGGIMNYFRLVDHWDQQRPLYAVQAPQNGLMNHATVYDLAVFYVSELKKVRPQGPYLLGGWSFGGIVAVEMARLLLAEGQQIPGLVMYDSYLPSTYHNHHQHIANKLDLMVHYVSEIAYQHGKSFLAPVNLEEVIENELFNDVVKQKILPQSMSFDLFMALFNVYWANSKMYAKYSAAKLAVNALMFRSKQMLPGAVQPDQAWETLFEPSNYDVLNIDADHYTLFDSPMVNFLAQETCKRLDHFTPDP